MTATDRRTDYRVTFLVLCVGVSSFSLLQSMVNPVLPTIEAALDTDQATVTWVLTAYLLSASVFTPIIGRIGDKVGKERMLVVALATLAVGSLMAALAPSIGVLIAARAVQGVGGGVLPLTFGIIRDEFPREKVAGAVGTSAALLAVGGGFGLVLAGPLVEALSYHWLFWLPMVMTALAAVAAAVWVPESPERTPGRINVGSALLLSGWLVALLLAVSQGHDWGWGSRTGRSACSSSPPSCCRLWVLAEARSAEPLVDMRMMRIPTVWTVNLVALLFGMGMYSMFAFLPQFLQTPELTGYGFGVSVTESGLLLLPQTAATFVAGLFSGRLAARVRLQGRAGRRRRADLAGHARPDRPARPALAGRRRDDGARPGLRPRVRGDVEPRRRRRPADADRRRLGHERQHPHRRRRARRRGAGQRRHRRRPGRRPARRGRLHPRLRRSWSPPPRWPRWSRCSSRSCGPAPTWCPARRRRPSAPPPSLPRR